uniref:Uncharacterized protein n=1 Tax=Chromera velia CCMP2878 TaxID=1169474 RepID=A0A0G4I2F2_9ALVE|eukprot:Cvel_1701.t1-p1 / transcript=Cvel_1701.t1 / gene=Cvel_1701 / organism=Chromera_velia_CCMP2878 / gene_product=hypothetical protein / transcript_product=hypothetical protein / location=Cvel_scaffold61:85122-89823(-) / protein_length=991 / sequence_SO=supercontig / SO=protein_coding / is_pseudo=false
MQTAQIETEGEQSRQGLSVLLQHLRLTSETLSDLAKHEDSVGVAWLCASLFNKNKTLGKVSVDPPDSIDLSGSDVGTSPAKVFLFLESLPSSVKEIILDSVAVRGRALPRFLRFLERLQSVRKQARGKGGKVTQMRLQSFVFGENSMGPPEAPRIFPLLLPCLESLSLKGNLLGLAGFRGLAEALRVGHASSLRTLDLERTGLNKEGLEIICKAITQTPLLHLETLNLSQNDLSNSGMSVLCPVLSVASLPHLRVLVLRNCGFGGAEMHSVAHVLEAGRLPKLETLDLEGNEWSGISASNNAIRSFGRALRKNNVPHLRNLNLMSEGGIASGSMLFGNSVLLGEDLVAILGIVRLDISGERDMRPLEHVQIGLRNVHPRHLRALAVGWYPSVRTLGLGLAEVPAFLRALAESPLSVEKPVLEALDVCLHLKEPEANAGREGLELLGESIEKGRLGFIRKIKIRGGNAIPALTEARGCFFQALRNQKLPRLSVLSLVDFGLVRSEVKCLVGALKKGNLPRLRVLDLRGHWNANGWGVGGIEVEEMSNLMNAVVESEESPHDLEELNLSRTNAGRGAGALGWALRSGNLRRLSVVNLSRSCLSGAGVRGLAEAVREGALLAVSCLNLKENADGGGMWRADVGSAAWTDLFRSMSDSSVGLPNLRELDLSDTSAGESVPFLGAALLAGKLGKLVEIGLRKSGLTNLAVGSLANAVRFGCLVGVSSLQLSDNEQVEGESWEYFFEAIAENEDGLPSLKRLDLIDTEAKKAGGPLATVLGSGKLPSLEGLRPNLFQDGTVPFELDDGGVQRLSDAVRAGRFPPGLCRLGFRLVRGAQGIDVDRLISAISESEKGLPWCVGHLNLRGGRLGEDSLVKLARSGGGSSGGRLSNLKDLALCDCEIDDQRLKRLAEVFCAHGCPQLRLLNLFLNKISPEGLTAFVDTLSPEALPCLIDLSLGGQQGFEGREEGKRFARHVESVRERVRSEGKLKSLRIFR